MIHPLADLMPGQIRIVTWEVTQDDIDLGTLNNCYKCPVALSLNRLFPAS